MVRVEWMTWHRRLGVAVAILVVLACVSGVLINHGHALGLDRLRLHAPWLQRLYGLSAPEPVVSVQQGALWWSQWGSDLYRDGERIEVPPLERLLGAFRLGTLQGVADRRRLLLLDARGALVDAIDYPAGGVASRAGLFNGSLVVELPDRRRLRLRADTTDFEGVGDAASAAPEWAAPAALPAARAASIRASWRGEGVTLERVLLDVHSGRWLGTLGPWLMDLAALVLLVLAGTGVSTVLQRWRRGPLP